MDKDFLVRCLNRGMSTREIEKICSLNHRTISYWIKKYNLQDNSKYKKLEKYAFEKIDTKEKAYALGFILADGSISEKNVVEVSVSLMDKEVCDFLTTVIGGNVNINNKCDKKKRSFPKARVVRKITDIVKFTGGRNKSDRHFPRVRDDLDRYLIQGLFDADGCITWGRRKDKDRIWHKVSFTSQYKILVGVQQYLYKKLNISSVVKQKQKENCYYLEFSNKKDVLKFCEHIYPDREFLILKRKYSKYKALRLELEENGESDKVRQYRAEPAEQEGVETSGDSAMDLNNHTSIQGQCELTKI